MVNYTPPTNEMNFLLNDVLNFNDCMSELDGFEDIDIDLATGVIEEIGRFCVEILEPLNRTGDEEGCHFENGNVRTPAGFPQAYLKIVESGWPALSGSSQYGGQGLPHTLQLIVDEIVASTNMSFGLFTGLTRGATDVVFHHADEELKSSYLPKMISGEWTGVMSLTEASAGSDLGLLTTKASPQSDGSYKINGTKIFISSGDHDFGGNVIHLVLARMPGAPAGVKGISLFLVPKILINSDGSLGQTNSLNIGALEHKMGIHAQPTCVINYDGATGWLVGEANRGLSAMFTMMNAERLFVGVQGLGIAEAAFQKAKSYACERLQGRSADRKSSPVPIIEHPDVLKMLLTIRSFTESARALSLWTALQMDKASHHSDEAVRSDASGMVALLTPIIKASMSDFGFESAVLAQQVFGGHGYIREWGMEQHVRDARITQIYEGTNGVQAMDLVSRKLFQDEGELPHKLFALIKQDLDKTNLDGDVLTIATPVLDAVDRLEKITLWLQSQQKNPQELGTAATDYLRLFALVLYGWMWVKMVASASASENTDQATSLFAEKVATARFFTNRILPQTLSLEASIASGADTIINSPLKDAR